MYLYYAPNDGVTRNLLSRFTVTGDTIDLASEKQVLRVDTQRNTCCHAGGSMTFDGDGNLYLATGDNTNPFESNAYSPIDERPGRQDYDAQRTSANTNDLRGKVIRIHPEDDGTYTVPAGNLFAPGTEKTRPEIYAMGFRNPFRIGTDPKTNTLYVARLRAGRQRGQPEPGPPRPGRVEHRHPGQLRLAVLHGHERGVQRLHVPVRPERREVRLRRAGEQLAQQHRPDQPPAGGPGDRRLRVRR